MNVSTGISTGSSKSTPLTMDGDYCVLLALALFLEIRIGSGEGMLGTLVFNASEDDLKKSK
jgi:hypothetical protein